MRVTIQLGTIAAAGTILLAACGGAAAPSGAPAAASSAAAPKPVSAAPAASASAAAKPSAAASGATSVSAKPAASGPAVALPKPEVTSVKIGNASHEAHSYPPQYALEQGLYKKYGLTDVKTTYFDGDAKARQAILAGQIDIMSGSPGTSIITASTDTPVLTIGMYVDHPTDDLVSVASVKNVGDLKGKKVAVSSYGGDSHASVVLALKALGITSKDVTIVEIGGESARIAALTSGTVAAAPVDETNEKKVKAQGLNILVHLPDAPVTLARTGLLVRKDFAAKNPNTVLVVLAATLEAEQLEIANKDQPDTIASYAKWIGAKDNESAHQELNSYPQVALRSMRWKQEGFDNLKEVLVSADPKLASVDVTKTYDYQYLDKLHSLGFDKAVGVPGA